MGSQLSTDATLNNDEDDYEVLEKVGQGSFGVVYKIKIKKTQSIQAMKKISFGSFEVLSKLSSVMREIHVLRSINHDNLVKYNGAKFLESAVLIFTEFMDEGSLYDVIQQHGVLTERKASRYIKEVLTGVKYLHSINIIHRDIKCGNILLDSKERVKLSDFGLSKHVENAMTLSNHTFCGCVYYLAPEIIKNEPYCSSVDIWAIGVTVVEMLTQYPIYPNLSIPAFLSIIVRDDTPITYNLPNRPSSALNYFLKLTFNKIPDFRPFAQDLLYCKFINANNR